jgi:hypothetical protein
VQETYAERNYPQKWWVILGITRSHKYHSGLPGGILQVACKIGIEKERTVSLSALSVLCLRLSAVIVTEEHDLAVDEFVDCLGQTFQTPA